MSPTRAVVIALTALLYSVEGDVNIDFRLFGQQEHIALGEMQHNILIYVSIFVHPFLQIF